jgi:hypothetical protein
VGTGTPTLSLPPMAFPGLNFLPGIGVEAAIRSRYGEPVNYFPIQGLKEFTLLVSVGRCKFKLSEQCIGFLLQATLGGVAVYFRPQQIYDKRSFRSLQISRSLNCGSNSSKGVTPLVHNPHDYVDHVFKKP